jgi:hypothetical protein
MVANVDGESVKHNFKILLSGMDYHYAGREIEYYATPEILWEHYTGQKAYPSIEDEKLLCTGEFTTLWSKLKDEIKEKYFAPRHNNMYSNDIERLVKELRIHQFMGELPLNQYEKFERILRDELPDNWPDAIRSIPFYSNFKIIK